MSRYSCVENGASKFWEGNVKGRVLTTSWGKLGTAGQSKAKELASEDAANKELAKLIKEKLAKGYVLDGATKKAPTKAVAKATKPALASGDVKALEAAIAERRGDVELMLAYAATLPPSDARAELIVLQAAIAREQARTGRAVLDERFDRQRALLKTLALPEPPENVAWNFRTALGHVKSFDIEVFDWDNGPHETFAPYLARLLAVPFMRFVTTLEIKVAATAQSQCQAIVDALAELPQPSALRVLDLRIEHDGESVTTLRLDDLWASCPRLVKARVLAGALSYGTLALLNLEEIDFAGAVKTPDLARLATAQLPRLNTLQIDLGAAPATTIASILDGSRFPELIDLTLRDARDADAVSALLGVSPLAAKLRFLSFPSGAMTDDGARALATKKWRRLELLAVEGNLMTNRAKALLETITQRLMFGEQRNAAR